VFTLPTDVGCDCRPWRGFNIGVGAGRLPLGLCVAGAAASFAYAATVLASPANKADAEGNCSELIALSTFGAAVVLGRSSSAVRPVFSTASGASRSFSSEDE
jgi:hypothetical protein